MDSEQGRFANGSSTGYYYRYSNDKNIQVHNEEQKMENLESEDTKKV